MGHCDPLLLVCSIVCINPPGTSYEVVGDAHMFSPGR